MGQSAIEMVFVQSKLSDLAWLAVAPSALSVEYQQPNGSATKHMHNKLCIILTGSAILSISTVPSYVM